MAGRGAAFAIAIVGVLAVLTGCSASTAPPEPTPLFASEEEAFAAAEAVYREYVDAVNESNSGSSTDPMAYLIGSALEDELESRRDLEQEGVSVSGSLVVAELVGVGFDNLSMATRLNVCVDVSDTRLTNVDGNDITTADRAAIVPLEIVLVRSEDGLAISEINGYPENFNC